MANIDGEQQMGVKPDALTNAGHKGGPQIGVCFFLTNGHDWFLLQRSANCRDEHHKWDPGAGKVEFGEALETALYREVKEEYNAKILTYTFLGIRQIMQLPTKHWIQFDHAVHIQSASIGEPEKSEGIRQATLEQIVKDVNQKPEDYHSMFPLFLNKYEVQLMKFQHSLLDQG